MQSDQREMGEVVLKSDIFFPPLLIVAGLTFFALLSFMDIIRPVATDARRIYFCFSRAIFMAGRTLNFHMTSHKFKMSVSIVIKYNLLPRRRRMAITAFGSILAFMHIIDSMTIRTSGAGVYLKLITLMASVAFGFGMPVL